MSEATIEAIPSETRAESCLAHRVDTARCRKRVLVLMPFGGAHFSGEEEPGEEQREATRVEQRRAVLEFLRLKYLLSKISADGPYAFDVEIAYTLAQDIPAHALAKVSSADMVIAVLTHRNINVMYEVAVRHLLRDEMILMIGGEPDEEVPVYLRDKAYLVSDPNGDVSSTIDFIAKSKSRQFAALAFSDAAPPDSLRQTIDEFGEEEQKRLGAALAELIEAGPRRSPLIESRVAPPEPEERSPYLSNWAEHLYYPVTVVKIDWKRMSFPDTGQYDPSDIAEGPGPVIFDANQQFLDLVQLNFSSPFTAVKELREFRLTMSRILNNLKTFMRPADHEEFQKDQIRLTDELIFKNQPCGAARVPIRLNERHPYRNRMFLPCLIGKKVEGDTSQPHSSYLIVVYIEFTSDHLAQLEPVSCPQSKERER
jgi:hypothetical protein